MLILDEAWVASAMEAVAGVKRVTRGWPKRFENLPCIAVQQITATHHDYRDDVPYVEMIEVDVRVFFIRVEDGDAILPQVDDTMGGLGYTRVLFCPDDSEEVRMRLMRYRRYAGT